MKDIDFLPKRYREQSTVRKGHLWRFVLLLLFGSGIGATAAGQFAMRRSVTARAGAVDMQHQLATTKNELHQRLLVQLADVHSTAQLYAYLNHPWPRTQILAAVAGPLPETVTLSELRVHHEMQRTARTLRFPQAGQQGDAQSELAQLLPAERDLERFKEESDGTGCSVHLTGYTDDAGALHEYLGKLSQSYLFVKAELDSLESAKNTNQGQGLQFTLRLVVRPGYGQPGGPSSREQEVAVD